MKAIIKYLTKTVIPEERLSSTLFLFRVFLSLSLIKTHGLKKILSFQDTINHIPDPFGLGAEFSAYFAVVANVICPIFIIFGLFTRVAIIPILSITLSGFFLVHISDPWPIKDVPLMYSLSFLLLFILGPGKVSLDYKLIKK